MNCGDCCRVPHPSKPTRPHEPHDNPSTTSIDTDPQLGESVSGPSTPLLAPLSVVAESNVNSPALYTVCTASSNNRGHSIPRPTRCAQLRQGGLAPRAHQNSANSSHAARTITCSLVPSKGVSVAPQIGRQGLEQQLPRTRRALACGVVLVAEGSQQLPRPSRLGRQERGDARTCARRASHTLILPQSRALDVLPSCQNTHTSERKQSVASGAGAARKT